MRTFCLLVILFLSVTCQAATTYYVAPAAAGNGSGLDAANAAAFRTALDTTAVAGDTLLCQPGDYTVCRYTVGVYRPMFGVTQGTNVGTSWDAPITIKGDPATTTCLPEDWYTRRTNIPAFDTETQAYFGSVLFFYVSSAPTSANNYYIILDGLCMTDVNGHIQASAIKVQNCAIVGNQTDRASTSTDNAVSLPYYGTSWFGDWTISGCFIRPAQQAILIGGSVKGGPVTIDGCNIVRQTSSSILWQPTTASADAGMVVTDTRIFFQASQAGDAGTPTIFTIDSVSEANPKKVFVLSSGSMPSAAYYAIIYDISAGTSEVQDIDVTTDWVAGTSTLTLDENVSFDVETGVDKVYIYDCTHGSGFSLRKGFFTARRNVINGVGSSRLVYTYGYALENLTITDNLFYGSLNVYGLDIKFGDNFTFCNNTVAGRRPAVYYETGHLPTYRYGHALSLTPGAAGNLTTAVISNNIAAGRWDGGNLTNAATLTCNHLYYNGSGTTFKTTGSGTDPENYGNITYYTSQPYGSEPTVFASGGGYFLATDASFDTCYTAAWLTDPDHSFDSSFDIGISSPARDVGDPSHDSGTDINGNDRDATPDVGAFEYQTPPETAPTAATTPSPEDNPLNLLTTRTPTLSWTSGDNTPTHHIFFGTTYASVLAGTGGTDKGTQVNGDVDYAPGTLNWDTTYYWRVDEEKTDETTATGTVWTFTIGPRQLPPTYVFGRKG